MVATPLKGHKRLVDVAEATAAVAGNESSAVTGAYLVASIKRFMCAFAFQRVLRHLQQTDMYLHFRVHHPKLDWLLHALPSMQALC